MGEPLCGIESTGQMNGYSRLILRSSCIRRNGGSSRPSGPRRWARSASSGVIGSSSMDRCYPKALASSGKGFRWPFRSLSAVISLTIYWLTAPDRSYQPWPTGRTARASAAGAAAGGDALAHEGGLESGADAGDVDRVLRLLELRLGTLASLDGSGLVDLVGVLGQIGHDYDLVRPHFHESTADEHRLLRAGLLDPQLADAEGAE